MNSSLNIDTVPSTAQAKINTRMQQTITAAKLKAVAESVSVKLLNENFSAQIGGTFDVEYETEIKHTPRGLSSFVSNPTITFSPHDMERHKHLPKVSGDVGDINLSYVKKLKNDDMENPLSTALENHVEQILNFVEDEIQPEICKYLYQAKRKNDFTKSTKKNRGKNTEKAMQVMNSATLILQEKFKLQN